MRSGVRTAVILALAAAIGYGCGQTGAAADESSPATAPQLTARQTYVGTVSIAQPDPGVRCYIIGGGYPAMVAMSCVRTAP